MRAYESCFMNDPFICHLATFAKYYNHIKQPCMTELIKKILLSQQKSRQLIFLLIFFHFVDEETLFIWAATSFCMASV